MDCFPAAASFALPPQANDVASKLEGYTVDYVISSPFRRCLQTSAGVVKQLGLQQGQWLVDWQLSEVRCGTRESICFGYCHLQSTACP
jgi:broad specificity phosphatase PhoE